MKPFRESPDFLTKFPIDIWEKKHSKTNKITGTAKHFIEKRSRHFKTKYGYFNVDKAGNVNFTITLVDIKARKNYTIKIAKQYIYDSLLIFLMHKPIRRKKERNEKLWIHNNITVLHNAKKMNNLTPQQVRKRYNVIKEKLEGHIADSKDELLRRRAELQLRRLLTQQWKTELLEEIFETERFIKKEWD